MTFTYSTTSIVFPASASTRYGGTSVRHSRKQNRHVAEDNTAYVYDRTGVTWFIELKFRVGASGAGNYDQVRDFFKDTVSYSKLAWTFTPDANMDAGAGLGGPVTVRLWQDDIGEVYVAPGRWEFTLILRTTSVGSGYPS